MAAFNITIDTGQEHHQAVAATGGSTTKAVTVIIDPAQCVEKREALALLDKIKAKIEESGWPTAPAS